MDRSKERQFLQNQFGMRIAYLRRQRGLSQLALALEAGIAKSYLSDLERGCRNPTLQIAARLATALGYTLEELFKGVVPLR